MSTRESQVHCKDCGKRFIYSEYSVLQASRRGESAPERCPECTAKHSRQTSRIGAAYVDLIPEGRLPERGIKPGRLGRLSHGERAHLPINQPPPEIDADEFGIRDCHLRTYLPQLERHQVSIVQAPTGSGKSTFFPFRLMEPPAGLPRDMFTRHGSILVTQPRIEATTGIPEFVAKDLFGASDGADAMVDIGYRHSKARDKSGRRNRLIYLTDGTLLNMLRRGQLDDVSIVVIDEAHERTLTIDLILALMRRELQALPHLKLIIASATIDESMFRSFFEPDFDVLSTEFPGKTLYPIVDLFSAAPVAPDRQLVAAMPDAVAERAYQTLTWMAGGDPPPDTPPGCDPHDGDILAFLPGKRAIDTAIGTLKALIEDDDRLRGNVEVLPLYAELPAGQRRRALGRSKRPKHVRWRVVVSTNLAETSLTVEGIRHVIDSGLINTTEWDPATITQIVRPALHSRAGLRQRRGRAGRVASGVWHCLLTAEQHAALAPDTPPEIVRAPLEVTLLACSAAGYPDPRALRWLPPGPLEGELQRAQTLLRSTSAVDDDGDPTSFGHELSASRESFASTTVLLRADLAGCAVEAATVLSALAIGGAGAMLRWNRRWPAVTKLAVDRIHRVLAADCVDDLDVVCTLIADWEGTPAIDRDDWAERRYVEQGSIDALLRKREQLMAPLLSITKTKQLRPLDRSLLDRLRAVVGWTLGAQTYTLTDEGTYAPTVSDGLHAGALVELDRRSRCVVTAPALMVPFARQRRRRWISPLEDPVDVVHVDLICALENRHLHAGEVPLVVHLKRAAETAEHPDRGWWRADVLPGERFRSGPRDFDGMVELLERLPSVVLPDTAWGEDADEVIDTGDTAQTHLGSDELDDEGNAYDTLSGDDGAPLQGEQAPQAREVNHADALPAARYTGPHERLPAPVVCTAGDRSETACALDDTEERFQAFADRFAPEGHASGQLTEFRVVRVARFQNDSRLVVELEHEQTGLVVPCSAEAFGVGCRDVVLADLAATIAMDVVWVDRGQQFVVLDRTTASAQALAALTRSTELREATIVDAFEDRVYLRVDNGDPFVVLTARANRLPNRPSEMRIGQVVRIRAKTPKARRWAVELPQSSDSLRAALGAVSGVEIHGGSLVSDQPISVRTRAQLIAAVARVPEEPNVAEVIKAITHLWRRGATPMFDVVDVTGIRTVVSKGYADARVLAVHDGNVDVELGDGTRSWVPRRELGWQYGTPAPEVGAALRAYVRSGDADRGELKLTFKDPATNPYLKLTAGDVLEGTVIRELERGGYLIALPGGATGLLGKREARDDEGALRPETAVPVRVLEVEAAEQRVQLSGWLGRAEVKPMAHKVSLLEAMGAGRLIVTLRELTSADLKLASATFTITVRAANQAEASSAATTVRQLVDGPSRAIKLGRRVGHWLRDKAANLNNLMRTHGVLVYRDGDGDATELVVLAPSEEVMQQAVEAILAPYLQRDVAIGFLPEATVTAYKEAANEGRVAWLQFTRGARGRATLSGSGGEIAAGVSWLRAAGIAVTELEVRYDPAITIHPALA